VFSVVQPQGERRIPKHWKKQHNNNNKLAQFQSQRPPTGSRYEQKNTLYLSLKATELRSPQR